MMADAYDIDGQPRLVQTATGCQVDIGADSATLDCIATPTASSPCYTWRIIPNSTIQLQSTPSLLSPTWTPASPTTNVPTPTWTFAPTSTPTHLYYRLLWIR